jgi:Domain of unknown function (DUF4157)
MHSTAGQSKATNAPSHDETSRSLTRPVSSKHPLSHPLPGQGLRPNQEGLLERKCACGGTPGVDGECAECRGNRLQRGYFDRAEPVNEASPIVHEGVQTPGQPLSPETRAFMEPRFAHDFSKVRVHTDAKAAESAQAVHAAAYTIGPDIAFGAEQHAPGTREGRRLLAHELTHVVQQDRAATEPVARLTADSPTDTAESEADRTANEVHVGKSVRVVSNTARLQVQRQDGPSGGGPNPPPSWLSGVPIIQHIQGNIYEINVSGYGPTKVGPYSELDAYLRALGSSEQAHHIVGEEHLGDVPTGFTKATGPAVALEVGTHRIVSARITAELNPYGGRSGGRTIVTSRQVAGVYRQVYTWHTGYKELAKISDNILGVQVPAGGTSLPGQTGPPPSGAVPSASTPPQAPSKGAPPSTTTASAGPKPTTSEMPSPVAEAEAEPANPAPPGKLGGRGQEEPEQRWLGKPTMPSLSAGFANLALAGIKSWILFNLYQENEAKQKADEEVIHTGIVSQITAGTDAIVDRCINFEPEVYANITVGTYMKYIFYTSLGVPETTEEYMGSMLLSVEFSNSDKKGHTEVVLGNWVTDAAYMVKLETNTQSILLPLDSALVRSRLASRIAIIDQQIAQAPSVGDTFSLQLMRDDLHRKLALFQN